MIKVALTGNIASGKSEVQKILTNIGYKVFDTDECAHKLLENNEEIVRLFGTNDRKILSSIVFEDNAKLKQLENILHPLVKDKILDFFCNNPNSSILFVAVPQLFESGFDKLFDKIVFVSAPYNLRLSRLIARNGYDKEYALLRLNSQQDEDIKIKKSDCVIVNNATLKDLEDKTRECLKLLL